MSLRTTAGRCAISPTCRTTAGTSTQRRHWTTRRQSYECDNPTRGPVNTSRWNTGLTYAPPVKRPELWYSFTPNNRANPARDAVLRLLQRLRPDHLPATVPRAPHRRRRTARRGEVRLRPGPESRRSSPSTTTARSSSASSPATTCGRSASTRTATSSRSTTCSTAEPSRRSLACPSVRVRQPDGHELGLQDGHFYLLTYGDGFFDINPDAAMAKFSYVKGTRSPVVVLDADPTDGPAP